MEIRTIRIVARNPGKQRAKGQETHVFAVGEDGSLTPLTNVVSAKWEVKSRTGYCTATLVLHGAEIDADGFLGELTNGLLGWVLVWKEDEDSAFSHYVGPVPAGPTAIWGRKQEAHVFPTRAEAEAVRQTWGPGSQDQMVIKRRVRSRDA